MVKSKSIQHPAVIDHQTSSIKRVSFQHAHACAHAHRHFFEEEKERACENKLWNGGADTEQYHVSSNSVFDATAETSGTIRISETENVQRRFSKQVSWGGSEEWFRREAQEEEVSRGGLRERLNAQAVIQLESGGGAGGGKRSNCDQAGIAVGVGGNAAGKFREQREVPPDRLENAVSPIGTGFETLTWKRSSWFLVCGAVCTGTRRQQGTRNSGVSLPDTRTGTLPNFLM